MSERTLVAQLEEFASELGAENVTCSRVRLVLEHGRAFTGTPWATWRGRGYRRGAQRHCYANAARHADRHPELTYCEGFADAGLAMLEHAWCITDEGTVADPTWREKEDGLPASEWRYFGIALPTHVTARVVLRTGFWGVLGADDGRVPAEVLAYLA